MRDQSRYRKPTLVRASWIWLALAACGGEVGARPEPANPADPPSEQAEAASCPAQTPAPEPLPGIVPEHETLSYWLEQSARYGPLDASLLSPTEIRAHRNSLRQGETPLLDARFGMATTREQLRARLGERMEFLRERFAGGRYVEADAAPIDPALADIPPDVPVLSADELLPVALHVATDLVPLHCAPRTRPFYTRSRDPAFDRNRCSAIRAQEPVEVFGSWTPPGAADPLLLVRSPYALGWIPADAPLSPEAPAEVRELILHGPRAVLSEALEIGGVALPLAAALPAEDGQVLVGSADGFDWHPLPERGVAESPRALTRREFLQAAFSHLGEPYGWGGYRGGRDCSRFVLDVMARFGLSMPRNSAVQAQAGSFTLEVDGMSDEEKALALDEAMERGVVLLHFPGHIMIYLGRDAGGEPMAIHSFSEYVEPCVGVTNDQGEPAETIRRVDRVAVTNLRLGARSSRGSFLERLTKIAVFGRPPGPALEGIAAPRSAARLQMPGPDAQCDDSSSAAIFRSPARPNPRQPLRVILTLEEDPGPVELVLLDPRGTELRPEVHRLGGPPYTWWAEIPRPRPGRWTVALGDGERLVTCERFGVARHPAPPPEERAAEGPAWRPVWRWERDTENLYSAFVEQLFRDPEDEDITWTQLQEVIGDRERNLLYDHRQQGEDAALALVPDCADLPYFLRAYFSWKLRLPFAWRQCRRGRDGRPPMCDEAYHHVLEPTAGLTEVEAFTDLIRRVGRNVHSSSNRTRPRDELSDVYPIDIRRDSIRPGAIFADPYGHVMVVSRWVPQARGEAGALVAADAQPDGTVGRRRFWRGAFLFDPDTRSAGAGFKYWRPVTFDRTAEPGMEIQVLPNAELQRTREHPRYAETQYETTREGFYERMDALINPRPRPAESVLVGLVDALHEAVVRRVNSVSNGEEFMRGRGYQTVEMPEGASIFQTNGPWEDYSTPSRDLRLLVSIDAVMGFIDRVGREPGRYGVRAEAGGGAPEEALDALRGQLAEALGGRRFSYVASDGREVRLTLQDLVARSRAMEMAYNPNDCAEIRWGAPEGGDERQSCRRHAPSEQRARMESYRGWFERRQRPAR